MGVDSGIGNRVGAPVVKKPVAAPAPHSAQVAFDLGTAALEAGAGIVGGVAGGLIAGPVGAAAGTLGGMSLVAGLRAQSLTEGDLRPRTPRVQGPSFKGARPKVKKINRGGR